MRQGQSSSARRAIPLTLHGEWLKSAIFISPGVLTAAWTGIILEGEAPELLDFCEDLDWEEGRTSCCRDRGSFRV